VAVGELRISEKKSRAFTSGLPQCLADSEVLAFNVVSGCPVDCHYCKYQPKDPTKADVVHLYTLLGQQVRDELASMARRDCLPKMVLFNTITESFFGNALANRVAGEVLEALFAAGVYVNLSTKGIMPRTVMEIASLHPHLVTVTVNVASLSESFHRLFEPRVATPEDRFQVIRRLRELGVPVRGRIEPLIPTENDSPKDVELLLARFREAGVRDVVVAYLHYGADVANRLARRVSRVQTALLGPWYRGPNGETVHLVDKEYRKRKYADFKQIAQKYSMRLLVCACRNADIYSGRCFVMPAPIKAPEKKVLF
jgi:DNA repair photolyase